MTEGLPAVHRTRVGGVPTFWGESQLPFFAGLVFRVGRADETLRTSGITHLVEHLALPARHGGAVEFNGMVDATTTTFWVTGPRDAALELLAATAQQLHRLPLQRLEAERGILLTEAESATRGHVQAAAALRFGARGHGLVGHEEWGLYWLGAEELEAWARARFTAGNAALYLTAAPPAGWELPLPPGERAADVPAVPVPDVRFPSVFPHGPPGSVAVSLVGRRGAALSTAVMVAERRIRDHLRYRAGATYEVAVWFEPLTAETTHAILWADCREETVDVARAGVVAAFSDLADSGPTGEELDEEASTFERMLLDPTWVPSGLNWAANWELMGSGYDSPEELLEQRRAVTRGAAASALREALEGVLLIVPEGTTVPRGRFTPYPLDSPVTVTGRRFRPKGIRMPLRRSPVLTVGPEGVMHEGEVRTTVRFADLEAVVRWDGGLRGLWGADGSQVFVDPSQWRRGDEATRLVDEHAPDELVVPLEGASALADPALAAGVAAAQEGRLDAAEELLEEGISRAPDDPLGWCWVAAVATGRRRNVRALEAADRAIELAPGLEWPHRLRARALLALGRRAEARAAAERARELEPADPAALADFALLAIEMAMPRQAVAAAERAVELHPADKDAWIALAAALDAMHDHERAAEAAAEARRLAPKDPLVHNLLGWLALRTERPEEALKHFDRALKGSPDDVHVAANRADALAHSGREKAAADARRSAAEQLLADAERRLSETADDPGAALDRVMALRALGRPEEALAAARAGHERAPAHSALHSMLVAGELEVGTCEGARAALDAVADAMAEELPYLYSRAWVAAVCGGNGAEGAAKRLLELHPDDGRAHSAVGYAAAAAGNDDAARDAFRRAATLSRPHGCCPTVWLGILEARSGDAAGAERARAAGRRLNMTCEGYCANKRLLEEALREGPAPPARS